MKAAFRSLVLLWELPNKWVVQHIVYDHYTFGLSNSIFCRVICQAVIDSDCCASKSAAAYGARFAHICIRSIVQEADEVNERL